MATQSTTSFLIRYANGTYNKGWGFEVNNAVAATLYTSREEAETVGTQLSGDFTIYEVPLAPLKKTRRVGPRWHPRTAPRPSKTELNTLLNLVRNLRDSGKETEAGALSTALAHLGVDTHKDLNP